MQFIKATSEHIDAIAAIYGRIIDAQEQGRLTVGWQRGVYPTRQTALDALGRGDLFVCVDGGQVVAAAIINRIQVPVYAEVGWLYHAEPDEVMVLHTLVVDPLRAGRGYGTAFVAFYEGYARQSGCPVLRMDTNEKNAAARRLYARLGYREAGIVPCVFNGIKGVGLVCLEKNCKQGPFPLHSEPFFAAAVLTVFSITTALPLAVTAKRMAGTIFPPLRASPSSADRA